jgi:hypothetical protein
MDAIVTLAAREREIGEYKVQMHQLEQYRSKNARLHDEKERLQADKGGFQRCALARTHPYTCPDKSETHLK